MRGIYTQPLKGQGPNAEINWNIFKPEKYKFRNQINSEKRTETEELIKRLG